MKNYKVNFTEQENNLFNTIEKENIRNSVMSLYAYLSGRAVNGSITFSYRPFLNKYNRYHQKLSLGTLKNRINTLVDLGLVTVVKVKQACTYKLNRFLNSLKPIESTENTNIEADNQKLKYINNINNIDIDLYSNSNNEFDSSRYEKCTSLVDVRNKVRELLKVCKVKSNWIKDRVLVKVSKAYRNITVKFLENYILKAIEDARNTYKKNWIKYTNIAVKPVREANFTQREYDWEVLEQELLGWN
ncbi:plasmid replication protein [Clostridium perfringens]|uniref:plasmid replication protein n=1 Tax=Clostridium perfringens TaxID=1502 RepID=UPI0039EB90FB